MKSIIRVYFLLICILVFQTGCNNSEKPVREVVTPQPLVGQNVGEWGETVDNLCCRLETDKKVYCVGDAITLGLTFKNVGDKEIVICYKDILVPGMLSFRREDGTAVQKAILIVFKLAPLGGRKRDFHTISPGNTHLFKVAGRLLEQNLYGRYLSKQNEIGNLILKFEQAFMLGYPGVFFSSFQYRRFTEWAKTEWVAKENPGIWTGTVKSGEVAIEIKK